MSIPVSERTASVPVCISTNEPVPYVFLVSPARTHAWPNSDACWSPAMPDTGMAAPRNTSGSVAAKRPHEGSTSGSSAAGMRKRSSRSSSQASRWMSYSIVREALVWSVAWARPPVSRARR